MQNDIIEFKDISIDEIAESLQKLDTQIEGDIVHTFSAGLYIRELRIPKGALIVGHRHREKTMNMLIKGKMVIYDGKESITVTAPFIAESEAFVRKAGYAIEDSVWVNIFPTDETDIKKIEDKVIISEKDYKCLCFG